MGFHCRSEGSTEVRSVDDWSTMKTNVKINLPRHCISERARGDICTGCCFPGDPTVASFTIACDIFDEERMVYLNAWMHESRLLSIQGLSTTLAAYARGNIFINQAVRPTNAATKYKLLRIHLMTKHLTCLTRQLTRWKHTI